MRHKIEIAPNLAICIDGKRVIGSKPHGLYLTTEMIVSDEDLKRLSDRCLEVISDRKTEPSNSEKPNNCEELNAYRECIKSRSFWDSKHCDGCYFDERCPFDEPKDEPQTDCAWK